MNVGDRLPVVTMTLDSARLVMYAGASWDWHPLHYDADYARAAGLKAPIADGQMFGALFADQFTSLLGPRCQVKEMEFRFHSMVFVGETIEVAGEITSINTSDSFVDVSGEQRLTVDGRLCSTATTTVRCPT